jgi:hypothetical protein
MHRFAQVLVDQSKQRIEERNWKPLAKVSSPIAGGPLREASPLYTICSRVIGKMSEPSHPTCFSQDCGVTGITTGPFRGVKRSRTISLVALNTEQALLRVNSTLLYGRRRKIRVRLPVSKSEFCCYSSYRYTLANLQLRDANNISTNSANLLS